MAQQPTKRGTTNREPRKARPDAPSRAPRERPGPVGGKRQQNRQERIQGLTAAGLDLFLERGVEGVTIDAIVERAGIAKGSFYRYFRDKEDMVATLFKPVVEAIDMATDRCGAALAEARTSKALFGAYEGLAADLAPVFLFHHREIRLYLQECRGPAVGARRPITDLAATIAAHGLELTGAAHAQGLFRQLPPEVTSLAVIGAAERLLFSVLRGEPIGDPFTVSQTLISVVVDGMRAR